MISQDLQEVKKCCEPWEMEEYAEFLSLIFTGRSSQWNTKLGEQMTEEEMVEMREKMLEKLKEQGKDIAKLKRMMEEGMKKMEDMMKKMPLDLLAVVRVQMMVFLFFMEYV